LERHGIGESEKEPLATKEASEEMTVLLDWLSTMPAIAAGFCVGALFTLVICLVCIELR
jgi:dienelactone hydrolase